MKEIEVSPFSINLKFYREKANLSQKALGRELGISGATISYYENGKQQPPIDLAKNITDFFGVSLNDFMSVSKNIDDDFIKNIELREKYKKEIAGDKPSDKAGDIYTKNDNTSHKEGNSYEIEALKKSLEDKERIIAMLEQRVSDKEELNKMLRNEVDRLKNELQGYKSSE